MLNSNDYLHHITTGDIMILAPTGVIIQEDYPPWGIELE